MERIKEVRNQEEQINLRTALDFNKLTTRYKQFGGLRLVLQYAKLGVLPIVVMGVLRCVVKKQSFKAIYPKVLQIIEPFLIKKYSSVLQCEKKEVSCKTIVHEHPKVIWWCWLQGLDKAPEIVSACYNSLKRNLSEYEIKLINAENWKEYVELPENIIRKWEKKQIPPALFSDLLRVQLLIKYGGTWIDSTVLCTLDSSSMIQGSNAQKYLDADLFLFQYTPEGTTKDLSISNWFISARSNNEVLMTLRDMLFAYWKDYNCTLDYYIFHLFFAMVATKYPAQIAAMPYGYSMNSLVLLHHCGETFEKKKWDKLIEKVCFHKLAFRIGDEIKSNKENYYNHILETYGGI